MTVKTTGIQTIEDIFTILENEPDFDDWHIYGHVNTKTEGNYILFNYSAQAQYEGRWNNFERMSRGLIVDRVNLRVMARPFDKFFNWGERGFKTDSPIDYVMEKMDGSLGICWYDPARETVSGSKWRITTRGSFNSEQAIWATNFLNVKYKAYLEPLNRNVTYLFEIIYPENRVVVDYGNESDLFMLGSRHNTTGLYSEWGQVYHDAFYLGCPNVQTYGDNSVQSLIEQLVDIKGVENEGFVTVHHDGTRWKFKGHDYLRIHKVISTFSFKHTLDAIAKGSFDEWIESVPDEFLTDIRAWQSAIEEEIKNVEQATLKAYYRIISSKEYSVEFVHGNNVRKVFALKAKELYPQLMPFLFAKLDGRLDRDFILRKHDFSHI